MSTIAERATKHVNLDFYRDPNLPEEVGEIALEAPESSQYVLRCPIKIPGSILELPDELQWTADFVSASYDYQQSVVGVDQPYAYLTVRHGPVVSRTDDALHVDGFSMKVPHIPEQNYVWANRLPTEVLAFGIAMPDDFDPLRHNLQYFIQDSIPPNCEIQSLSEQTIYAMDPYIFHRRPKIAQSIARTFVRLSLTPIPIDDVNNHINPAFGNICSDYDGVTEFRDTLERYALAQ